MARAGKVVLHSLSGYRPELDALVRQWIERGVKYVGVVGVEAAHIEDVIDDLCVGDGTQPYFMLTASHGPEETVADAIELAGMIDEVREEGATHRLGDIELIEF
jgi:hypothetical protein